MPIRKAKINDIQAIFKLVKEFHKDSLHAYAFALDEQTLIKTIEQVINNNISFVSYVGDDVTGVIAGVVHSSIFDYSQTVAYELFWFVSKKYRNSSSGIQLLQSFEQYCRDNRVSKIVIKHMENLNSADMGQLYERKKYRLMELEYIKDIAAAA